MIFGIRTGAVAVCVAGIFLIASRGWAAEVFALDSAKGLQAHKVTVEAVTYQGRKAVRVMSLPEEDAAMQTASGGGIVMLPETSFHNGTIQIDLAGKPRVGAPGDARGFVGVAFRVDGDGSKYECFYIRPTNGRADDQLRRNHSTQYISFPEYEWQRLRTETPGQYESYVDLLPGEWTRIRVEVSGVKARLFVNGGAQPVLVVNDLKHGDGKGGVALWIGMGTEAYFANLRVGE
jgi:hypothetical protein